MKYIDGKPRIKSGDLLAWTHKKWDTWYDWQMQLIRFFTRSEYVHVGIAVRRGDDLYILESVVGGIRMRKIEEDLPCFWVTTKAVWTDCAAEKAFSKMGQPYSKWQAISSLFFKIKPGADQRWECAEFAQFVLNAAGVEISVRSTPSEVVACLVENNDSVVHYLH